MCETKSHTKKIMINLQLLFRFGTLEGNEFTAQAEIPQESFLEDLEDQKF